MLKGMVIERQHKKLLDPIRLRSDSMCWENDEFYEILVCSSTFSSPRMISNVFKMFLYIPFVMKLLMAKFLWAKYRGFVVFSLIFSIKCCKVFTKYCKALKNIRIVFIMRAVCLPSFATCLRTKSPLLSNGERLVSCLANHHRPRHVFRYNRRSFKTHSNTADVYKNVFDKSN